MKRSLRFTRSDERRSANSSEAVVFGAALPDRHVSDDRQMIGGLAGAAIDKARLHCICGPAEYAVKAEDRIPGRKRRMLRACRKLSAQSAAQRSRPEPFIEIAKHHRRHWVPASNCHKATSLGAALS